MSRAFKCDSCGKFQEGQNEARFRLSAPLNLLDGDALESYVVTDLCDTCLDELVPQIRVTWWRIYE